VEEGFFNDVEKLNEKNLWLNHCRAPKDTHNLWCEYLREICPLPLVGILIYNATMTIPLDWG